MNIQYYPTLFGHSELPISRFVVLPFQIPPDGEERAQALKAVAHHFPSVANLAYSPNLILVQGVGHQSKAEAQSLYEELLEWWDGLDKDARRSLLPDEKETTLMATRTTRTVRTKKSSTRGKSNG